MKVLLIGNGFVGKATYLLENPDCEFLVYDINPELCVPKNFTIPTDLQELRAFDIIFICLPTPMGIDGKCDTSLIEKYLFNHPFVIIRSTVPVGFCYNHNIYFMPEFLTEKNWKQDFMNSPIWYLGGPENNENNENIENHKKFKYLLNSAKKYAKIRSSEIIFCSSTEAELLKYSINTFLANKVSFFNEINSLASHYNISYDNLVNMLKNDPRIGNSHLTVPGPDSKHGYGGTCFPKDTTALYNQFLENNIEAPLLQASLYRNEIIDRPEREWIKDVNRAVSSIGEKKIVLVTGGAGFLGSHLCKNLLTLDKKVVCIDNLITGSINNIKPLLSNPDFKFLKADVTKPIFIPKVHEIYHLAGIASPPKYKKYPLETLTVSIQGTINMLELAKRDNAKFLFTSTSEVYGDPLEHPQKESYWGNVNIVGERSCYDEGKRVAETIINEYRKKYNLDTKIVRIFNTYGPNMDINDGRVITNFIKSVQNNEPLTIYGTGEQTRSFAYVDDTIDGILRVMDSTLTGPINIGNPIEFTINELAKIFNEIYKRNLEIQYLDKTADDPLQRNPDITLISSLQWIPKTFIKEGLEKTIEYFDLLKNQSKL